MNKTELVEAIASSTELTKTDVDKVVTALVDETSKYVLVVKELVETQELVKQ